MPSCDGISTAAAGRTNNTLSMAKIKLGATTIMQEFLAKLCKDHVFRPSHLLQQRRQRVWTGCQPGQSQA